MENARRATYVRYRWCLGISFAGLLQRLLAAEIVDEAVDEYAGSSRRCSSLEVDNMDRQRFGFVRLQNGHEPASRDGVFRLI